MKLTFLGTRGYIEARNRRHHMHSSLQVSYYDHDVIVDRGEDWLEQEPPLNPVAIVITHAHPDHALGLKNGACCPVYATEAAWADLADYPIEERREIVPRQPVDIGQIRFEAFPVEHSTLAPAVGYRITAGQVAVFYVPDVVWIEDRAAALTGTKLYIGDGATVTRSMVRKSDEALIGHTPVRTQLTWCQKEGVPRAIFTHCGSDIVARDERVIGAKISSMAQERNVEAQIAYDGLELVLR